MTYTVDPEALRAVARRLDAEARELRAQGRRLPSPDAGGMAALVDLVLTDVVVGAGAVAATVDGLADSLRFSAALGVQVDQRVADGLPALPSLEDSPWAS